MGKIANIIWIIISVVIASVAIAATYISLALPNTGKAANIKIDITPDRVARGKYLADNVAACKSCHSKRDWSKYAGPVMQGSIGQGGERFDKETGFPGTLYASNITPYNLHNWSDGELVRAITEGETKDGTAIFPLMPYRAYAKMSKEDVYSIIAYLRTLPAIKNEVPQRSLDFPLNFVVNIIPAKAILSDAADTNNTIARGKYLTTIANCIECHSKIGAAKVIEGTEFGGGWPFKLPNGTITYSANITPDKNTGTGNWSNDMFIKTFRQHADNTDKFAPIIKEGFNTPMPWAMYAGMTAKDLSAIYYYLQTVTPLQNKITKFEKVNGNAAK